jgi:hypothetical protein
MTSDLFPDCKMDSPRLAWMKRHGVEVRTMTEHDRMFVADNGSLNYVAETGHETAYGETEHDALAALGIPLWNEEQYAKEKTK